MVWTSVVRVVDSVSSVLLAPACAACRTPLDAPSDGPVCASCWSMAARVAPEYDGALRDIIHAFKFDGRSSLAKPLAGLARQHAGDLLRDCTCAVPVPLHPWRRLHRGFNQAHELARFLGVPVVHALWRMRATPPQSTLGAAARRSNVRHVFSLSPWMRIPGRQARWLHDRNVLLVDDVRTTGATLDACADVLRRAGAREVRTLTVARAAPPRS